MANDITNNPLIFDTAGSTSAYAKKIRVKTIWWEGAANGNTAVINTENNGARVWQSTWATNNAPHFIHFGENGQEFDGLYVQTLGGGVVLVYEA